MSFNNLGLIEPILRALEETGYTSPTKIQEQSIPIILTRRDLLGCAQTGTGKTAAFTIPMLQLLAAEKRLDNRSGRGIASLILAPTRELALQIGESIETYGRFLRLKHQVIFGGVPQFSQVKALQAGVDILVATPGRLLDLMQQGHVTLKDIQFFVLDEADRMLDVGFFNDIKKIMAKLPQKRQNLLFSATMPHDIKQLAGVLLKDPASVEVTPVSSTVERIDQSIYHVEKPNKIPLLLDLLADKSIETVLVFTQMKHTADKVCKVLVRNGISAQAIHGNKSQGQRQQALSNFRSKATRVLVATDIAARGIDVTDLTHVINYELPDVPETYVHRIGRTGRAGAAGIAISFCDQNEKIALRDIQKLTRRSIEVVSGHRYENAPAQSQPPVSRPAVATQKNPRHFAPRRNRSFSQPA